MKMNPIVFLPCCRAMLVVIVAPATFGLLTAGCGSDETSGGDTTTEATGGTTSNVGSGGANNTSTTSAGGSTTSTTGACVQGESNCFGFFVTSRARLFKLAQVFNGSTKGWGGDFRYGTGDGLKGADKICTEIAEESLPGNGRTWKAFLSTSTVNAIDRVGSGPWYDRLNRLIANDLTELGETRPGGITDSAILNNLPNEDGTPHHNEEVSCTNLNSCADNHDVLTGSDTEGKLCTASTCAGMGGGMGGITLPGGSTGTTTDYTCQDWTLGTSISGIAPRVGHTWPTMGSMGGGTAGVGSDDWISQLTESGCAPGYNLAQTGGGTGSGTGSVGDGGGYGAIYCLARN